MPLPRSVLLSLWMLVAQPLAGAAPPPALSPSPAGSPFTIDLRVDLPLTVGGLAIGLLPELFKGELAPAHCAPLCDPAGINALDRTVIGNRSPEAQLTSDVFLASGMVLPYLLDLIDVLATRPPDGLRGFGQDVMVLTETAALNFLLNNVVKFAVNRPRPLLYDAQTDEAARSEADAGLSFYSGHSSMLFAMATAYSYLFTLRHPRSRMVVPVWLLAEGFAAATAYLRVHAGKHFWTDVLCGAVVGSGVGLLVPYLHHRRFPGAAGSIRLLPAAYPGGMGLVISLQP